MVAASEPGEPGEPGLEGPRYPVAHIFGGEMVMQQSPCHATAAGGRFSSSMLSDDGEALFAQILIGIDASMSRRPSSPSTARRSSGDVRIGGEVSSIGLTMIRLGGVLPQREERLARERSTSRAGGNLRP